MRIEIIRGNEQQLAAALKKANGRATKNTATVADVFRLAERAELQLDIDELPVSHRAGIEATWCGRGPAAKAYGYRMTRTRLTIRRGHRDRGWYLTCPDRAQVYPRQPEKFDIRINCEQRDWIIRHVLAPYSVRAPGHAVVKRKRASGKVRVRPFDGAPDRSSL